MKLLRTLIFITIIFNVSCTSYKQVPYFQDVKRDSSYNEKISNYSPLTVQPGDLLGINVTSLNHEADLVFNYDLIDQPGLGDRNTIFGHLIDPDGNINLPILGLVNVSGYTTKEISAQLELKLQTYLSKPVVNVRLLNFKISVLGDVEHPGSFTIQNEKITLPEAISLAGDLNTTAFRKNVLLIREKDGNRQYVNIDLTSKQLFNSPFYYLKNNDVIYAQPNKARVQNDAGSLYKLGLIVSAFSSILYAFALYITRH